MKLTLTVTIENQQLDAASDSVIAQAQLQARVADTFSKAAKQAIETRIAWAKDQGKKPSDPMPPATDKFWKAEGE